MTFYEYALTTPCKGLFYAEYMNKIDFFFLILTQNICCWYSKEPSQGDGSFEHPTHFQIDGKENNYNLRSKIFARSGPVLCKKRHLY